MKCQMKNKAVAFNLLDPDEKKLFDHAMQRVNFSKYMKRLIQRDMDNAFVPTYLNKMLPEVPEQELELDDDLMKGLLA